ncbi:MAG TPA: ABC transporter ATP-binding protein [Pirellulaceae bacterium]|jgi:phospholipid/cholesterol/gamma-HCH transport system ATP-binding protein|nr:ABC transporter ATP-binding protein [Pirellulaceae bacterium]
MNDVQSAGSRTDEPLVELRQLDVSFGRDCVLRDISLSVSNGQTLAIIGESGCGKTVLLKTVIGLIRPSGGSVLFDNHDLSSMREDELSRERIRFGFVFQNAALFDSLTVGQNVSFPLRQHGRFSQEELKQKVLSRLAAVGLPDWVIMKKPAELSGGMRKRVGLARALVMDPELVLYDEPTTGLDPIMSDVINELMLRTSRENPVTSIIVTHDMRTATKVADRIVMMLPLARISFEDPQIIFDGTPSELTACGDTRVQQFVRGEAGERLMEMRQAENSYLETAE